MISRCFLAICGALFFHLSIYAESTTSYGGGFYKDDIGDADIQSSEDNCFDITGLMVEARGDDTLRFTIHTKEPLPEKPTTSRTWIGLYVDLDQNSSNGLGGDDLLVTLTSETTKDGFVWKARPWTPGKTAQQFEFTASLVALRGTRLTMEVSSPRAFKVYPRFFVTARSQKEGDWIDKVESASLRPVTLFPFTDESLSRKEGIIIVRRWDPSPGKFIRKEIPVDDQTTEIHCKLMVHRANVHKKWISMFRITFYNADGEDVLDYWLVLSTSRKGQGVMRVYRGKESKQPHFLEDIPVPVTTFTGPHEMILRMENDEMEFEIDGHIIERQRKTFSIDKALMRFDSAEMDIEMTIR